MAFNKFDPYKETDDEDMSDASRRRVFILTWVRRIVLVYTAMGFALIVYWAFG